MKKVRNTFISRNLIENTSSSHSNHFWMTAHSGGKTNHSGHIWCKPQEAFKRWIIRWIIYFQHDVQYYLIHLVKGCLHVVQCFFYFSIYLFFLWQLLYSKKKIRKSLKLIWKNTFSAFLSNLCFIFDSRLKWVSNIRWSQNSISE